MVTDIQHQLLHFQAILAEKDPVTPTAARKPSKLSLLAGNKKQEVLKLWSYTLSIFPYKMK